MSPTEWMEPSAVPQNETGSQTVNGESAELVQMMQNQIQDVQHTKHNVLLPNEKRTKDIEMFWGCSIDNHNQEMFHHLCSFMVTWCNETEAYRIPRKWNCFALQPHVYSTNNYGAAQLRIRIEPGMAGNDGPLGSLPHLSSGLNRLDNIVQLQYLLVWGRYCLKRPMTEKLPTPPRRARQCRGKSRSPYWGCCHHGPTPYEWQTMDGCMDIIQTVVVLVCTVRFQWGSWTTCYCLHNPEQD